MALPVEFQDLLRTRGIPLSQLGVDGHALAESDALRGLEILLAAERPALGGDVYVIRNRTVATGYANWRSDPRADESSGDFLLRSHEEARTYIRRFPQKMATEAVFTLATTDG
jgi:hypothetical protein